MAFHRVCPAADLPTGESRMFVLGERRVAVFHLGDGLFAIDDECPHAGASLARGYVQDCIVSCRIHHWRFRLEDGQYLDEEQPQHDRQTYPVRWMDGWVEVDIDRSS